MGLKRQSLLLLIIILLAFLIQDCDASPDTGEVRFVKEFNLDLAPSFIDVVNERLIVTASDRIDKIYFLDRSARPVDSINLNLTSKIVGLEVLSGGKVAVLLTSGINIYDLRGRLVDEILYKEDGKTPLIPAAASYGKDRLYVADEASRVVYALSLVDVYARSKNQGIVPITLKFEVVAVFPSAMGKNKNDGLLKRPTSICLSPDGRVFVGDSALNEIKVYSCNGRYLYDFEELKGIEPTAIEYDDKPGSVKIPKGTYDPAATDKHGRVHVCDRRNAKIHVFSTMGKYLFSYGDGQLAEPSDIAIDTKSNLIYVADPKKSSILVYRYH